MKQVFGLVRLKRLFPNELIVVGTVCNQHVVPRVDKGAPLGQETCCISAVHVARFGSKVTQHPPRKPKPSIHFGCFERPETHLHE